MIDSLSVQEGDELDFVKYGDGTFLVVKRIDIKGAARQVQQKYVPTAAASKVSLRPDELALLKKLDTLRYEQRTQPKVASMLNGEEKRLLQVLINRKIINPFKKQGEKELKYGIAKGVYDNFLFRGKKPDVQAQQARPAAQPPREIQQQRPKPWEAVASGNPHIDALESQGYVVLSNEADAAMVSGALEESIRHGLIIGTRAFNRKFYIGFRSFINRHAPKILKGIEQNSRSISYIAKDTGIDEDGVRTILYVLSESGDVTEVRKDIFRAT